MAPSVTFQPVGRTVTVTPGTSVLEVAQAEGIFLRHLCGGQAICGTCRFTVEAGGEALSPLGRAERRRLAELYAPTGVRLACQARIEGDLIVRVPVPSLG